MKNEEQDCGCWRVELPPRTPDFAAACSCGENCECRARRRVRATVAGLAVCVGAGVVAGLLQARSDDSRHLATLRDLYLKTVEAEGPGR